MSDTSKPKVATVTLDHPFDRDGSSVATIAIRTPTSGEMRGLSVGNLTNADYNATATLLTRVTLPPLTRIEVDALHPSDFVQCAGEVMDFLLPKAAKPASQP